MNIPFFRRPSNLIALFLVLLLLGVFALLLLRWPALTMTPEERELHKWAELADTDYRLFSEEESEYIHTLGTHWDRLYMSMKPFYEHMYDDQMEAGEWELKFERLGNELEAVLDRGDELPSPPERYEAYHSNYLQSLDEYKEALRQIRNYWLLGEEQYWTKAEEHNRNGDLLLDTCVEIRKELFLNIGKAQDAKRKVSGNR